MAGSVLTTPPTDRVYVDEPWLLMRWDSARRLVHSEWSAFANSAGLRAGLLKGIQAIKDQRAVAYVTDTRKVKVVVHDDQKWIEDTWLPLALEAGLKRIGVVTAASGLGTLTVEDVVGLVDHDGLLSRSFDSLAPGHEVGLRSFADSLMVNRVFQGGASHADVRLRPAAVVHPDKCAGHDELRRYVGHDSGRHPAYLRLLRDGGGSHAIS